MYLYLVLPAFGWFIYNLLVRLAGVPRLVNHDLESDITFFVYIYIIVISAVFALRARKGKPPLTRAKKLGIVASLAAAVAIGWFGSRLYFERAVSDIMSSTPSASTSIHEHNQESHP